MENQEKKPENVPYIVHESAMARFERIIKRLWITIFVLLGIIVATNGAWLWYESQFEEISMTQEATTDGGGNAIVNGVASGDIYYGESASDGQSEAQENRG